MKSLQIDTNKIIQMYNTGLSCRKIADQLKCSESTITKRLVKSNIIKRTNSVYRKRKFNDHFFDEINSEEKAYWLGFLYADGCIQNRQTGQKLVSLAVKDKEVIDKFIQSIEGDFETKTYTDVHVVHLTSSIMFDALVKHGCIPRKSLVLKFPELNQSLIHHFIRGYFDGDGTVFICNPKNYNRTSTIYRSIGVGICGTQEFLEGVSRLASVNQPKKDKRKEKNIWYLSFSGSKKVAHFYDYIYKDATLYLTRKKEKFEQYFKERGSTTIIDHPTGMKV
jgi:intein-encoded DNA endonuclease-like protein